MVGIIKLGNINKKFNQELFDSNDSLARIMVTKYIESQRKLFVRDNPNKYGIDLYVYNIPEIDEKRGSPIKEPIYAIEVEIKRVWNGPKLPWNSVQLPYRKRKYAEQEVVPCEYWILNNQLTHAIIIHEKELLDNRLAHVQNKYVSEGEYFFQVPLEACNIIELSGTSSSTGADSVTGELNETR